MMKTERNPILMAALLALSFTWQNAYAADCSQRENDVSDVTDTLENIVISAAKAGKNIADIPSCVSVVTSLDAKKLPSPTISDVLGKEPGLSKGGDGIWATNINVRGLGENWLVTLIDRNRVEVASDLTTSLSMLNVNDIDHVEVIKGAQSSIYGSGAVGGIINVVTRDGHFADTPYFSGNFTANYSSMNNGHGEYLALYGGGKKWYLKVNGAFGQAGDVRTPQGHMKNSGYNTSDLGIIAAFKPARDHCLKLQFQRNYSWDVGIPGGAAFTPDATATYKNAGRTLASLNYDIDNLTGTLAHLNVKAFYQGIALDVQMLPNVPAPQTGVVPTSVTPYAEHHTFGVSAEGNWNLNSWNRLTAGAEMFRRNISSDRKKYIDQYSEGHIESQMIRREMPLPNASYTSSGIFIQDEMRFLEERLIFTLGGRFDINYVENGECHNVESIENVTAGIIIPDPPGKYVTFAAGHRTDPSWSANAGLLYKAGKKIDLTLNLSRSYRSPALEELFKFIDLSGNRIHFGNPDLKSEKSLGGDIGARFHSDKVNFRISAFVNGINDMIVERKVNKNPESVNDTLMLDNARNALLYGFDFDFSYEIIRGLKVYASGAWTIGRELSGQEQWLPMIPPLNGRAGISYENSRILGTSLEVTAAGARTADRIATGERPTDAWWKLDFAIHSKIFTFGRCNLQLFAGMENITDNTYTNFLATNRGNIICEPGRNIFIRANLTF